MRGSAHEVSYAVRLRVIGRFFGQFCLIVALLTLVPFAVALGEGEEAIIVRYLGVILVLGGGGWLLARLRFTGRIQVNEAMALAAVIFLAIPLVMTIPMMGAGLPFIDALFETVSAATTTGLSTVTDLEGMPATFHFARSWMQWYGGLGIVVLSLAIMIRPGLSAKRLALTAPPEEDLVGSTRVHARRVLLVYLALTLAGYLAWLLFGGGLWDGLLFILPAISTGGFAPGGGSLADLDGLALAWVVTLTSLAGAMPLAYYHTATRKGIGYFFTRFHVRLVFAVIVFSVAGAACCFHWLDGMSWRDTAIHAPLMAISAQSTAGFSSMAAGDLGAATKLFLILSMTIGGGIGSTAGGVKVLRLFILFGIVRRVLQGMSVPPQTVLSTRVSGRKVGEGEVQDALMVILVFAAVVFLSWLPFLAFGYPPLDALFEVVSATGTVGLSAGLTGPELPSFLKLVLCADMLLGRLEMVAWLVLFYPRTWFGRRRSDS